MHQILTHNNCLLEESAIMIRQYFYRHLQKFKKSSKEVKDSINTSQIYSSACAGRQLANHTNGHLVPLMRYRWNSV